MADASTWDFAGIALLDDLEPEELAKIAPWPGVNLTGEGTSGYSFFILSDGTARVTVDGVEVNTLGPGHFFGELALLGDGVRTATVTTTSPSRLLVLFGTEFGSSSRSTRLASRIEAGVRACLQPAA